MLHIELQEYIEAAFGETHGVTVTLCRDALEVSLPNGVALTLRVADCNEYAFGWRWGEAQMGIDTAPLHSEVGTFPNHLHTPNGNVAGDPISEIGADPRRNVRALIEALLTQPLLGYETSLATELPDAQAAAFCNA